MISRDFLRAQMMTHGRAGNCLRAQSGGSGEPSIHIKEPWRMGGKFPFA
jgi:hypothetical protein